MNVSWLAEEERQERIRRQREHEREEEEDDDDMEEEEEEEDDDDGDDDDDDEIIVKKKEKKRNANRVEKRTEEEKIPVADAKDLYDIPWTIYKQIVMGKHHATNSTIRLQMLDIMSQYPHTSTLQNLMLQELLVEFSGDAHVVFSVLTYRYKHQWQKIQDLRRRIDSLHERREKMAARRRFHASHVEDDYDEEAEADDSNPKIANYRRREDRLKRAARRCEQLLQLETEKHGIVQQETLDALDRFISFSNDSKLRLLYIQLLQKFIDKAETEDDTQKYVHKLDSIFRDRLTNKKDMDSETMIHYVRHLCQRNRFEQAVQLLQEQEDKDDKLWLELLKLSSVNGTAEQVLQTISEAVKAHQIYNEQLILKQRNSDNMDNSQQLFETQEEKDARNSKFWNRVLPLLLCFSSNHDSIADYFKMAIRECVRLHEFKRQYLEWSLMSGGLTRARDAIETILALAPHTEETFHMIIKFTKRYMLPQEEPLLMRLFSRVILEYGRINEDFWIEYIKHHREQGRPQQAQTLHDHAMKTLHNVDGFVTKYSQLA